MMHLPAKLPPYSRQRGAVGVAIALLIMFIIGAAVTSMMKVSGSSVADAARSEEQVSALFVAESGLERAQAVVRDAAMHDTYSNIKCTELAGQTLNVGARGSFIYQAAESTPATCSNASGNPCTKCVVTIRGTVGTSSRTLRAEMIANRTDGVSGQTNTGDRTANPTPNATLNLTITNSNSFVFTHLIYNPTSNWGGDAVTGMCTNITPGTSLTNCIQSWKVAGNYYNNPASVGVYTTVPGAGTYSITQTMTDTTSADTRRNYALAGVIFGPPSSGTIAHVGSYAQSSVVPSTCPTITNPRTQPVTANCSPYEYQHAYLPATNVSSNYWTCNPSSGTTPDWSKAGNANTLVGGFGGKPYYPGTSARCGNLNGANYYESATQRCKNHLSELLVNGQPLHQQLSTDGAMGDYMYSQIWWTHNASYYQDSTTANATNATSGVSFTGAIGATVTGSISNGATVTGSIGGTVTGSISGTTLTVTNISSGTLQVSDVLSSNASGTDVRNNTTIVSQVTPLIAGESLGGKGRYTVSGAAQTVSSRTITAASTTLNVTAVDSGTLNVSDVLSSNASGTDVRNNTTITALGTGTGSTGTYILSGNQQKVTSRSITATSTTSVLTVTAVSNGALRLGDVLSSNASGTDVRNNTTITALGTGTGSTGTYTVSGVQTVSSRIITAASNILRVTAVPSGSLSAGDTIASPSTSPSNPIIQPFTTPGTTGSGSTGDYALSATVTRVNNGDPTTMLTSGGQSTTITLTGATAVPTVGTALAVVEGTGEFFPDSVTGSISGITLTVTVASGTNLSAGDALFGANITANTRIVARSSGTGGTGTYTITPSQTAASGMIMARAAVTGIPTANSFTVSRLPSTAISNARLCGGLCPVLRTDGVRTAGQVDLTNIVDYDDWSAGFSCVSGADANNIESITAIMSKLGNWTEVLQ
jgi:hypothetical protein